MWLLKLQYEFYNPKFYDIEKKIQPPKSQTRIEAECNCECDRFL